MANGLTLTVNHNDKDFVTNNPTKEDISNAMTMMDNNGDDFFILEKGEHLYIQGVPSEGGTYYLDYRESEETENYMTNGISHLEATGIVWEFAIGGDFKKGYKWEFLGGPAVSFDEINDSILEAGIRGEFEKVFEYNDATTSDEIQGYLGYYNLGQWWLDEFSTEERQVVEEVEFESHDMFDPVAFYEWQSENILEAEKETRNKENIELAKENDGEAVAEESYLTRGQVLYLPEPAGAYLCRIAGMIGKNPLALKIADKAKLLLSEAAENTPTEKQIFYLESAYTGLMSIYYRWRDDVDSALEDAIYCAQSAIKYAPIAAKNGNAMYEGRLPIHGAYKQLTIIRDKQGDYAEAIRLSQEAMSQDWDGDWEKRIARYEKKLAKQK